MRGEVREREKEKKRDAKSTRWSLSATLVILVSVDGLIRDCIFPRVCNYSRNAIRCVKLKLSLSVERRTASGQTRRGFAKAEWSSSAERTGEDKGTMWGVRGGGGATRFYIGKRYIKPDVSITERARARAHDVCVLALALPLHRRLHTVNRYNRRRVSPEGRVISC